MTYTPTSTFGLVAWDLLQPWQSDDLGRFCDALGAMFAETWGLVMDQSADGQPDFQPGYSSMFDVDACPAAWLPYLGQYVGVTIPAGTSENDARQLIKDEAALHRGTAAAIRRAVSRTMTPFSFTATTTKGSDTLTAVSSVTGVYSGRTLLQGTGVPAGATANVVGGSTISLVDQDGQPVTCLASASGVTVQGFTVRVAERVGGNAYAAAVITDPAYTPDPTAALNAALAVKPAGIFPFDAYLDAPTTPLVMEYTRPLSGVTVTLAAATLADVI